MSDADKSYTPPSRLLKLGGFAVFFTMGTLYAVGAGDAADAWSALRIGAMVIGVPGGMPGWFCGHTVGPACIAGARAVWRA